MIKYDKNFDDDSILPLIIYLQSDPARGQVQFRHEQIVFIRVRKQSMQIGVSRKKEKKIKFFYHYIKGICNITSYYGIPNIKFLTSEPNQTTNPIQTDDIDKEFSKVFTEYIKIIRDKNSERANSVFTNDVFLKIIIVLELKKTKRITTSNNSTLHKIFIFSQNS